MRTSENKGAISDRLLRSVMRCTTPPFSRVIRVVSIVCVLTLSFVLSIPVWLFAEDNKALNEAIGTAISNVQKTGGREITLKAAEEVVNGLGDPISASGSHVKGLYTPGKSDHDFTHRVASELSPEEALDAWRTARRRFSTEIKNEAMRQFEMQLRKELGKAGITDPAQIERLIKQARPQAEKLVKEQVVSGILERTNLYPPEQVIGKVASPEEAMRKFKDNKTVPKLSEEAGKELSDDALKKATEGIYGPGAKGYRQGYESKAGVIWEIDPKTGKARKRLIDLTHMAEGYGNSTIEGMASNSKQWGDKVKDALKEGDYRTAFKDLERLHIDMKKARDLASLPSPGSTGVEKYHNQYNEIKKAAEKAFPADEAARAQHVRDAVKKLFEENPGLKSEIESAVEAASHEADLLKIHAYEFKSNRKIFIRKLLDGSSEAGSKLETALGELYEKYGHHISLINAISAIFIALDTAETASRAGQEDWEGALRKGIETALGIPPTLLPAGMMAVITNLIIDTAKDAGYALAVSSQDCEDLLAGIISVKGWEDVKSFGGMTETSVDEIARRLPLESQVRNLVAALARNAASGQEGTDRINKGKEEALVAKCSDQVLRKWRKRRMELLSGYLDLQDKLNEAFSNLNVELMAEPNPAQLKHSKGAATGTEASSVEVVFQARTSVPVDQINQLLDEMRDQIMLLGGKEKLVILAMTQETEWFKADDGGPFAGNKQSGRLQEVLDETRLVLNTPQNIKISCRIKWQLTVVSAITDSADFTTESFEILGPILKGELPGLRSRVIPGDVVGTHKDQLDRTYTKRPEVLVSVIDAGDVDEGKPAEVDSSPVPSTIPPSPSAGKPDDAAKEDKQGKPWTVSVGVQSEPYGKGQAGVGPGAEGQAGVGSGKPDEAGIPGQPGTGTTGTGQTGTGVTGETEVAGGPKPGMTEKPKIGVTGEAGVTGGQSGQAGVGSQPPGVGEGDKPVKEPTGADLKSRAEGRYKWIQDVLDYYEKLIELEKKAFQAFEKQVREFVMKKAAAGGYPVRDKETDKKIERLEEELKNVGVYVVKERTKDPLTGESFLGNVIKGTPPTPAEKAKAEELAGLKDPMAHEEFQCLDQGLQVRRDRLPEIKQKANTVRGSRLYNNFAEYSAWNQYKEYLSEIASLKSTLSLPDPIPSPVILPWSYSSSCGGAVVAPTKAKLAVVLIKAPDRTSYKPGDIVNVSAVVTGGKEPYGYTWLGNHAGTGQQVGFISSKPGDYTLSVEVKDAAGAGGSASMPLVVKGITASIEGLVGQVIYGTSRLISVSSQDIALATAKQPDDTGRKKGQPKKATAGKGNIMVSPDDEPECEDCEAGKSSKSSYRFVWFSDTEGLDFNPSTSNNPATEVRFTRIGPIKIWVEIQKQTGAGVYSTIGEARQELVTVMPPQFKWKFEPPKGRGKVGREVKATITTEPDIDADLIHYEWSYPESSNRMEHEKNASVIGFVPKEPQPMMLVVAPKVPHYRDPIGGGLKEEYQVEAYTVTVTGPKVAGPKPQIWKKGFGLVEMEKEIAVHQRVEFSAEVLPKPETDPRYNWTVSGGSCTLSNPIARDIGVTCSETGSYVMTVTVRDKENIELGKGTGNLTVTISQEELDKAATQAKPKVTVTADKTTLTVGESASVTATVDAGQSPYHYTWSGEHQGQGQSVRFSPKKPGDHTLLVEVTDAKGNKDSANIMFTVDPLQVIIEGLWDEVVYGTKLNLSAKPENHQIVWKSEPAITFAPQQGFGGKTVASFTGVGRVKVWAAAQQNTGGVIGESEKKEINVTPPEFAIIFDPPKGKVGDEVTATVKITPPIDKSLLRFVWESPKRSDLRPYDTNIVRFTPKSAVPVEFLVIVKEPVKSQTLAETRGTYTAEAVKLEVALKADNTRLRSGETTNVRADVRGGRMPYTFNWKGNVQGYGPAVRFNAQQSGERRLSVEVIDVMGNKGSADIALQVEPTTPGKSDDKGHVKSSTTFIPSLPPEIPGLPPEGYDPTRDFGFRGSGAGTTLGDVASADALGGEFQQGPGGGSKVTVQQGPQNVAKQPESYTTDSRKKPDVPTGTQQPNYPPSPPGHPPDSGQSDVRVPWGGLVGPSSGYGGKSRGKGGTSAAPASSLPYTSPPSGGATSGAPALSPPPPKPVALVTAEITNRSKGNVHIFTDGETFGPGNRVESGGMKRINVRVPSNNKITFYAGRNGQIIVSKTWYYDPHHPDRIPVIVFDESNPYDKLIIMKGLR